MRIRSCRRNVFIFLKQITFTKVIKFFSKMPEEENSAIPDKGMCINFLLFKWLNQGSVLKFLNFVPVTQQYPTSEVFSVLGTQCGSQRYPRFWNFEIWKTFLKLDPVHLKPFESILIRWYHVVYPKYGIQNLSAKEDSTGYGMFCQRFHFIIF